MTGRRMSDQDIDAAFAADEARRAFERSPEWLTLHPITNYEELRKAVAEASYGTDKQSQANRLHVIRRAKALGLTQAIPYSFNSDGSLNRGVKALKY